MAPQPRLPGAWWGLLLATIVVVAGICAMTLLGKDRPPRLEPERAEKPEKIDKPLPTDEQRQVLERLKKLLEN